MSKKDDLKALEKLLSSRGWTILKETMEEEIKKAAFNMASNSPMTIDHIHFQRGAMWAAVRLLDLPQRIASIIGNEILMEEAQAQIDSQRKE